MRKNEKELKPGSLDSGAVFLCSVICLVFLGSLFSVVLKMQCCGGANCNLELPLACPGSETCILSKTLCQKVEFCLKPAKHEGLGEIQVSDPGEVRGSYRLEFAPPQH